VFTFVALVVLVLGGIALVAVLSIRGRAISSNLGVAVVLGSLGVGVVGVVVAAILFTRSITRPMKTLGATMRRFGDGDLHQRATIAGGEIGVLARSFNLLAEGTAQRISGLEDQADRAAQLRVVSEALDLAMTEDDVHRISERAFGVLAPANPAEVLLVEAGSQRLVQQVRNPVAGPPNCPVLDAASCPAIKWGRTMTYASPDSLNACRQLRDRPSGPCSAVCVPMSADGQLIGVLHATAAEGEPPAPALVEQLVTLSGAAGARLGAMRTLASTQLQAATDPLTGLANRRSLESALRDLLRTATPFVLVLADLDHFKALNEFGYEIGDRALKLFSDVLKDNARGRDIVARFGGEEFVLAYPGMDLGRSMEVLERVRSALGVAVESSGLPPFTCSYGVAHSSVAADLDGILRVANAGLLMAKDLGRDRVVYADAELAAEVFAPGELPRIADEIVSLPVVDDAESLDGGSDF